MKTVRIMAALIAVGTCETSFTSLEQYFIETWFDASDINGDGYVGGPWGGESDVWAEFPEISMCGYRADRDLYIKKENAEWWIAFITVVREHGVDTCPTFDEMN